MHTVIIFYSNKRQLDEFTKSVFGRKTDGEISIFQYMHLQIIVTNRPINVGIEKLFAIFLDIDYPISENSISGKTVAIVDSENKCALEFLARIGAGAVVCGSNQADTVSFSSITEDTVTVCQQRSIKTLGGKLLEPREFPYKCNTKDVKTALLSATADMIINCN